MASRRQEKQARHRERMKAKKADKQANQERLLSPEEVLAAPDDQELEQRKHTAEKAEQAQAVGCVLGVLTALAVVLFAGLVGFFQARDAVPLVALVGMIAAMFGATVGIGYYRITLNANSSSRARGIRLEGLKLCLFGVAGVLAVFAAIVGLMVAIDKLELPVAAKTIVALCFFFCIPSGRLILRGLGQLVFGDDQSTGVS